MSENERIMAICYNVKYGKYSIEEFQSRLETFLTDDRSLKLKKTIDDIVECLEWDIYTLSPSEQKDNLNNYINQLLDCIKN